MLEKYLEEIGLSDKEASVYLALLQFDSATPTQIAEKTKLNRSTVYVILEALEKKGLANETSSGKIIHYQASAPEHLETFVENQRLKLEETAKKVRDIIPQIKAVQREVGERPVITYHEGREGIVASVAKFFGPEDTEGTAYFIYPKDIVDEIFTEREREKYFAVRMNKNIHSRAIYTKPSGEIPSDEKSERIRIDEKKYPITCDIAVYKDRVRINVLGKKLSGIFIRSQDLAETLRSIFNLVHDTHKERNGK